MADSGSARRNHTLIITRSPKLTWHIRAAVEDCKHGLPIRQARAYREKRDM